MNRDQSLSVLERTLAHVTADHATVTLDGTDERATRFANNAITQNVAADRLTLAVTAAFGQHVGSASTNQMDEASLRAAVRRAEEAARAADPNPEYLPPLPPQEYTPVAGYAESTAAVSAAERAQMASELVRGPAGAGDRAAGSVTTTASFRAVANTAGLRAYHEDTEARIVNTVLSDGAAGWAGRSAYDICRLPVEDLAERAWQKARAARNPEEAPAKPTTIVLEPQAAADLLAYLVWDLDARAIDEGRSAFTGLEGQEIMAPSVTIRSVPAHPEVPGIPFAGDGAPTRDVDWIRDGVLQNVKTGRFWAEKTGRARVDFPGNIVQYPR
jgi:predicted Zn-dependent protease